MKVFIFEHVCGGGMARDELPGDMIMQGAAMLLAAIDDFTAAGVQVVTTIDHRIALPLPAVVRATVINPSRDVAAAFDQLADEADAALVIAPECGGVLEAWCARLAARQVRSLGCPPRAVALCGDKLELARVLREHGVPTPATALFDPHDAHDLSAPVVVKPRFGAGCEGTYLCHIEADLLAVRPGGESILQPFAPGRAVSASFLVRGNRIDALLPGEQRIGGTGQLRYGGGAIPLDVALAPRAVALAERALRAVPGLNGFVGVDLVLGDEPAGDQVIEINPRLTTSYVALRRLCATNLAAAMLDPDVPLHWRPGRVAFDVDALFDIMPLHQEFP